MTDHFVKISPEPAREVGGVMEQACRDAKKAGGLTVKILPVFARDAANPVISIGGAWGTLSEIAFARKHGALVLSLGTWPNLPGVEYVGSAEEAVEQALA